MQTPTVLVIGKRGGILQWYEHLLATAPLLAELKIEGFALNHNNWQERSGKKLLKLMGQKHKLDEVTARALKAHIQRTQPILILIADLFYLSSPLIEALMTAKPQARIVHWIGDFFEPRLVQNAAVVDQFYFTDSSFIADANAIGIGNADYLPLAVNTSLFAPEKASQSRHPTLLFIGAHSENRQAFIDRIGVPITVFGKGWQASSTPGDERIGKNIPIAEVARRYRQHEAVLNVLNRNNVRQGLNMRCFEATACGALLITESSPDNARCFVPGQEIITYEQPEEIREQMAWLRSQPDRLATIALQGQHRTLTEHGYHHRIRQLLPF